MSPAEFEELVEHALDSIPEALAEQMQNVAILIEDTSPEPGLLGLYQGVPLTQRAEWYSGVLPDRIYLYRDEILGVCDNLDEVLREVRVTVIHEVAHYFGIDDERLRELGWG